VNFSLFSLSSWPSYIAQYHMEQSKSFPPQLPIPQKEEEEQEKGKYSLVEIQKDSSVIQKKHTEKACVIGETARWTYDNRLPQNKGTWKEERADS